MRPIHALPIALSLTLASARGLAAEAHVHGQAQLDVAIDGATLTLSLESPTDSLVGFEHTPSTDADRAAVARMKASFEQADKLFVPTPAASCKLKKVELHSPLLGDESEHSPGPDGHEEHEGHADLDGAFELACAYPERLRGLEVRLFDAFPNLKKVKVAVVAPKRQKAGELTATDNRIAW